MQDRSRGRGSACGPSGAGPGGSHGPLGPGRAPRCRRRVARASWRGCCRCWGCCSGAPPGLRASLRRSPRARRVSPGGEGAATAGPGPCTPQPLSVLRARDRGVPPAWERGGGEPGLGATQWGREGGKAGTPRLRAAAPSRLVFLPAGPRGAAACRSHCLAETPAQGRAGAGARLQPPVGSPLRAAAGPEAPRRPTPHPGPAWGLGAWSGLGAGATGCVGEAVGGWLLTAPSLPALQFGVQQGDASLAAWEGLHGRKRRVADWGAHSGHAVLGGGQVSRPPPHSSRPLLSPPTPSSSQYPKVVGRPPSLHPQAGGRMRWGRFPQQEQGW